MTTATEQVSNTVTIEDAGPACKRIRISIPAESVDARIEQSYGVMQAQTVLPGFRKGRVPRTLLEKRFGPAMRLETRNQLVADAYSKAIQDNGLRPVGEPELDDTSREVELSPGKGLEFSLTVEVVPEFDLPNVEGLVVKRPMIDVADEHIDLELKRQQFRDGKPERITGPFVMYDRLLCDAEATRDDEKEPFFKTDQALLVHPGTEDGGKGPVLGVMVDDLAKMLEGKKVGDVFTVNTVGPASHEREDIRGRKLSIKLTVRDAERITPASIGEVVDKFQLGTVENLRGQVRLALEQRRDSEQRAAMREQIYEHLIRAIDFPLPEKLSESQITRTLHRQRLELLHQGVDAEEVERRLAEYRSESESLAKNRLKLLFILAKIADQFGVQVANQEVNAAIAAMAVRRGERPEALRSQLEQNGLINEVALQIREHKTADQIISRAVITDVSAEEWNTAVMKQFEERQKTIKEGGKKKSKKSEE